MNTTVSNSWGKIESVLQSEGRAHHLRTGATEEEIAELERTIGARLPTEVRESYRLHDGQDTEGDALFGEWLLMPLRDISETWAVLKKAYQTGVFPPEQRAETATAPSRWWSPARVPVSTNGLGDHHMVDLDRRSGGTAGQVIRFSHERADRPVVPRSFSEWLEAAALQLERERFATRAGGTSHRTDAPSMEELAGLVGLPLSDSRVTHVLPSQTIEHERDGDDLFLHASESGYDITSHKGTIRQVDLYFAPATGEAQYRGTLIFGVQKEDARDQVRRKLGTPLETDKKSIGQPDPKAGWDAFPIRDLRVQFTYRPDWDGISWITITRAERFKSP